jgi:hypothetical protein
MVQESEEAVQLQQILGEVSHNPRRHGQGKVLHDHRRFRRRAAAGHGHRHPIAFSLLASGVALMWHLDLFDAQILAQNVIGGADSFPLLAVPFFMLAGEIMNAGGLSKRIVDFALALVGHVKGGLGYVTIMAGCLLSALSGSAVADAAALTALLLPMMVSAGHDKARAGGLIAATGVIGPVIPPSIGLVIFGVAANVSISKLFLAAIVPGLLIGGRPVGDLGLAGAAREDRAATAQVGRRDRRGLAQGPVGADAAGDHPGGPAHGRLHADRGGRGGRGVCAVRLDGHLPRAVVAHALRCSSARRKPAPS